MNRLGTVKVYKNDKIETKVVDRTTKEEYVLHLTPTASGKFVKLVRAAYQQVLDNIQEKCCETDIFKSEQANELIKFIKTNYNNELEFLWKKFPHNAIWRRSDTHKWYAALLTISKSKLNLDSEEVVTVLDLRGKPEEIEKLVDNQQYFPGYHMNKQNWYTIILDGTTDMSEIDTRLQASYEIAK